MVLCSIAFGGGIDPVPQSGKPGNLPAQLSLVNSDLVALLGQHDALRIIKRLDRDDSADSSWVLASTAPAINLSSYTAPLSASSALPKVSATPASAHTPRAPPVLS